MLKIEFSEIGNEFFSAPVISFLSRDRVDFEFLFWVIDKITSSSWGKNYIFDKENISISWIDYLEFLCDNDRKCGIFKKWNWYLVVYPDFVWDWHIKTQIYSMNSIWWQIRYIDFDKNEEYDCIIEFRNITNIDKEKERFYLSKIWKIKNWQYENYLFRIVKNIYWWYDLMKTSLNWKDSVYSNFTNFDELEKYILTNWENISWIESFSDVNYDNLVWYIKYLWYIFSIFMVCFIWFFLPKLVYLLNNYSFISDINLFFPWAFQAFLVSVAITLTIFTFKINVWIAFALLLSIFIEIIIVILFDKQMFLNILSIIWYIFFFLFLIIFKILFSYLWKCFYKENYSIKSIFTAYNKHIDSTFWHRYIKFEKIKHFIYDCDWLYDLAIFKLYFYKKVDNRKVLIKSFEFDKEWEKWSEIRSKFNSKANSCVDEMTEIIEKNSIESVLVAVKFYNK